MCYYTEKSMAQQFMLSHFIYVKNYLKISVKTTDSRNFKNNILKCFYKCYLVFNKFLASLKSYLPFFT